MSNNYHEHMLFDKSDDDLYKLIYSGDFNDRSVIEAALEELKYRKAIKCLNNFSGFLDPEIMKLIKRENILPNTVNRKIRDEAVKRKLVVNKTYNDIPKRDSLKYDDSRRNNNPSYGSNNDRGYNDDQNRNPQRNDDLRSINNPSYGSNNDRNYNDDQNRNPQRNDDSRRNNNPSYGSNNDRGYNEDQNRNPHRNDDSRRDNNPNYGSNNDRRYNESQNRNPARNDDSKRDNNFNSGRNNDQRYNEDQNRNLVRNDDSRRNNNSRYGNNQVNPNQQNQQMRQPTYQQSVYYVNNNRKSLGLALLLVFLFGPLGLLYSSVTGGLIMMFLAIPIAIFTLGIGLFFIWPICFVWAIIAINNANNNMMSGNGNYNSNY